MRGAFTEFAGAADRLGGEEGNPGWGSFRQLGDPHYRFEYPKSDEHSTTEVIAACYPDGRASC